MVNRFNLNVPAKILTSFFISLNLLFVKDLLLLVAMLCIFFTIALYISRPVNLKLVLKLFLGFTYIFIFTFFAHLYFQDSEMNRSFLYSLRLAGLILVNTIIALSLDPDDYIGALARILAKFKILKNFTKKIMLICQLAISFVPVIKDEARRVHLAQKCRGVDFNSRNILIWANNYLSLFIPVLVSCIKKADDISLAMKIRQFSGYQVDFYFADNSNIGGGAKRVGFYIIAFLLGLFVLNLLTGVL